MVSIVYKVECSCGSWRNKSVESGQSDQWNISFSCSHWTCKIWQKTKLGFLLGLNSRLNVEFYPRCSNCSQGWTVGDTCEKSFECCGQRINIRCTE